VNVHMIKNSIFLVTNKSIFEYRINQNYQRIDIDFHKDFSASELCDFPGLADNYGMLVANKRNKSGKVKIDLHYFVETSEPVHKRYEIQEDFSGEVSSIFFSKDKTTVFIFQEAEKIINLYKWEPKCNLLLLKKISLKYGMTSVLKFDKIHRIYPLYESVFLIYFQKEYFRIIDTDVIERKNLIFSDYFHCDLKLEALEHDDNQKDHLSYPLVFIDHKKESYQKPVQMIAVY